VTLHFCSDAPAATDLMRSHDLVIAADGANSAVRSRLVDAFGHTSAIGGAKYVWLGSTVRLPRSTFHVRRDGRGTFALHAYPFDDAYSTLVIEADHFMRRCRAVWTSERQIGVAFD